MVKYILFIYFAGRIAIDNNSVSTEGRKCERFYFWQLPDQAIFRINIHGTSMTCSNILICFGLVTILGEECVTILDGIVSE